jgi:hypothetical protein
VVCDNRRDGFAVAPQRTRRSGFIDSHQPTEAHDVGSQNSRQSAFYLGLKRTAFAAARA